MRKKLGDDTYPKTPSLVINISRILLIIGIILRLVLSWYSIGSNDAYNWENHANSVIQNGLFNSYNSWWMNHPPLSMEWHAFILLLVPITHLSFPFLCRLAPIAADIGCCWLLKQIVERRNGHTAGWVASAAYAWCLTAVLISAYHTNTDSIYAFFSLLAAYFLDHKKQFFYGGLALAAAINVKLIPVVLIAPLFSLCHTRKEFIAFATGLAIGALPFLPPLIFIPQNFYHYVLGYNCFETTWGIMLINQHYHMSWYDWFRAHGKYVISSSSFVLALISLYWRVWNAYELSAIAMALLLILANGFCVQYTVAVAPLIFSVSVAAGSIYGLIAGIFLFETYKGYWTGTIPFFSNFRDLIHPSAIGYGFATWVVLICFVLVVLFLPLLKKLRAGR